MASRVPHVLVVSLQKSGTHLMQGLMLRLGYKTTGAARPTPESVPTFDDEQLLQISSLTRSADEYAALSGLHGMELRDHTRDDWGALLWHWQHRLAQRIVNRYGMTRSEFSERIITNSLIRYTKFAEMPPHVCWILHELDIDKVDGNFLHEWAETDNPKIIFNYRDPRDVIVSMINYLEGRTGAGYGNFFEFEIFSSILSEMKTWEEKIDYALRDKSFIASEQFEKSLWLLRHPRVCNVSFEELVGPKGGGSRDQQLAAVARIIRHIGSGQNPESVVDEVYDQDSWTFHKGRTQAWQTRFTARNLDRYRERFGDLLEQYGYQ
jgi:hypothetical protein